LPAPWASNAAAACSRVLHDARRGRRPRSVVPFDDPVSAAKRPIHPSRRRRDLRWSRTTYHRLCAHCVPNGRRCQLAYESCCASMLLDVQSFGRRSALILGPLVRPLLFQRLAGFLAHRLSRRFISHTDPLIVGGLGGPDT